MKFDYESVYSCIARMRGKMESGDWVPNAYEQEALHVLRGICYAYANSEEELLMKLYAACMDVSSSGSTMAHLAEAATGIAQQKKSEVEAWNMLYIEIGKILQQ